MGFASLYPSYKGFLHARTRESSIHRARAVSTGSPAFASPSRGRRAVDMIRTKETPHEACHIHVFRAAKQGVDGRDKPNKPEDPETVQSRGAELAVPGTGAVGSPADLQLRVRAAPLPPTAARTPWGQTRRRRMPGW
jgi:hypothetical protein